MVMLFSCEVWHPKYISFDFGNYCCGLLKLDSLMRYVYLNSVQSKFPFPFYAGRTHMCVQQDNNPSCCGLGDTITNTVLCRPTSILLHKETHFYFIWLMTEHRVNWAYDTKLYNHE